MLPMTNTSPSWIRRVRECEERCSSLAREKKDRIRLGNTYKVVQSEDHCYYGR